VIRMLSVRSTCWQVFKCPLVLQAMGTSQPLCRGRARGGDRFSAGKLLCGHSCPPGKWFQGSASDASCRIGFIPQYSLSTHSMPGARSWQPTAQEEQVGKGTLHQVAKSP
jgi:hypothetical protein